jgi:hypothetical protein
MKFAEKVITFVPSFRARLSLEERNLLGVKLRMRDPQNHFWTAVARVAA